MRHTDLKAQLLRISKEDRKVDRQVIIIENTDPPENVRILPYAQKFTGNPDEEGRAGLFPVT